MQSRQSKNNSNAQDDAARLVRNAQDDAARLVRNAQDDAARLVRNAQDDAARLVRNAQDDASRMLNSSQDDELSFRDLQKNTKSYEREVLAQTNGKAELKKDKLYTIGEMSSKLAHDLQNPLTIIKNTMEFLKQNQPAQDSKTAENYERIDRAVDRMAQLIRDVLDYVRTSDRMMEKASLTNLLKTVLAGLRVPDGIKIILPSDDVEIFGDIKQLETVFSNLIVNAIQAIDGKGRIMIQASETGGNTVIDIIDNGRGIEKENLQRIFEPLFTTKQDGTGLGLASCKSIIETHGGTIECSSIVGKGTVFTIRFPKF
jgi:two-component system sensor histidine kinase HydH